MSLLMTIQRLKIIIKIFTEIKHLKNMKAQELRIGNYLKKDAVVKIDAKIIFGIWAEAEDYEPIPITEEWLFKFGAEMFDYLVDDSYEDEENNFTFIEYKLILKNKRYCYTVGSCPDGFFDFCLKSGWHHDPILLSTIKYVHELQNLYFALEREELVYNELVID